VFTFGKLKGRRGEEESVRVAAPIKRHQKIGAILLRALKNRRK
jgi:hypothetical protein